MESRLLQGTVDMLILDVLSRGDSYGYEIVQMVTSESGGELELKEGSLYPALHRLQRSRLLKAYWVDQTESRRRKYYKLTASGRRTLEAKRDEWQRFSAAVANVLGTGRAVA